MAPFYLSYIICNGPVSVEKFVSECCSRRSYASRNNVSFLLYRLGHIDIFLLSQQGHHNPSNDTLLALIVCSFGFISQKRSTVPPFSISK